MLAAALALGCPHRPSASAPIEPAELPVLEGQLFGAPFTVRSALALSNPSTPNVLLLVLGAEATTCDGLRPAMDHSSQHGRSDVGTVYGAVRVGPTPHTDDGTTFFLNLGLETAIAVGPTGSGTLRGTATLARTVGGQAGDTATVTVAYRGEPRQLEVTQSTDHLAGDVVVTLCEPVITALPDLADTRFVPTDLHVDVMRATEEDGGMVDMHQLGIDLRVALPEGWKSMPDERLGPVWLAPDGRTTFSLALDLPVDDVGAMGKLATPTIAVTRSERPSPDALVERGHTGKPPWGLLVVYRQRPDWPAVVQCELYAPGTVAPSVFDAAEAACLGLERIAPAPADPD